MIGKFVSNIILVSIVYMLGDNIIYKEYMEIIWYKFNNLYIIYKLATSPSIRSHEQYYKTLSGY